MGEGDVLATGTRLDELEIERVLGAGGFGITYLARDRSLDVWRAVKEYLPRDWGTRRGDGTVGPRTGSDAGDYRWGLERFLEEARILARFDHRSLVRVYRSFKAQGTAYMVMEHVEGRTLEEEVAASEPWPEARVREVLAQLMDGLEKVHGAEVWHRDIKPKNVMVRRDGTPVLIDFGAARQAIGGHSGALTAVLTPGYAPIEQYSPRGHQGPWTDIYALGATAYWALSGEVPAAATERVQADRLLPVAQVARVRVSARLAAAADAALAVYAADRPQSLKEWRAMLDRPPPGAGRRVGAETGAGRSGQGGTTRRRRWDVVAAGLAIAALVAALAVALIVQPDGSVPEKDPAPPEPVVEKLEPEMVVVPGGRFRMGCVSGRDCEDNEKPVHEVRVESFELGKYEVTFEEYDRFTAATGRERVRDRDGRGRRPVTYVSWEDAVAYTKWLSGQTGERYRLPSEAEWEYAARAGSETSYGWGNEIGRNRANCDGCGSSWDKRQTAPVGSFAPNRWGLHDMHGNVEEWVQDCWHVNYQGAPTDGASWETGDCYRRVFRGGSWSTAPRFLRSAGRFGSGLFALVRFSSCGFRVARTITP